MTYADLSPFANHLWQSTIFGAGLFLLTLACRKNRAAVRYWIWLAASIKFLVPFSVLVSLGRQLEWRSVSTIAQPQVAEVLNEIGQPFAMSSQGSSVTAVPVSPSYAPFVMLCVWLCGAIVGIVFWIQVRRRIHAVVRESTPLHVNLPIPVFSSSTRIEPGVFGIWRPVLVLPAGIADVLTPAQLEGILAHELCHVRRRDNLTAAIHMVAEVIFWFHPMVWWIRTQLVKEREQACDEAVIQGGNQPQVYAEAILGVCKFYLENPLVCASAVTGANLKHRIRDIIANRPGRKLNRCKQALLASAALASFAGPIAVGAAARAALLQEPDGQERLTFEVSSVKASHLRLTDGRKGEGSSPTPVVEANHLTFRARGTNLFALIVFAYGLKSCRPMISDNCALLSGGPRWLSKDTFDIEAKSPPGSKEYDTMQLRNGSAPQLQEELRNLLADRFHLKTHFEERQLPVYAFTVAAGGIRMKPTADASSPKIVFKGVDLPGGLHATQVVGVHSTIQDLANLYAKFMDRPVIDATGLTDRFDFTVQYELDPDATGPFAGATSPTLFAALEKQAGLKLRATKGPVKVLVIDDATQPSGN